MEKYTFEKRTFLAVCPLHPPLVAVEVVYLYLLVYNMAYANKLVCPWTHNSIQLSFRFAVNIYRYRAFCGLIKQKKGKWVCHWLSALYLLAFQAIVRWSWQFVGGVILRADNKDLSPPNIAGHWTVQRMMWGFFFVL